MLKRTGQSPKGGHSADLHHITVLLSLVVLTQQAHETSGRRGHGTAGFCGAWRLPWAPSREGWVGIEGQCQAAVV